MTIDLKHTFYFENEREQEGELAGSINGNNVEREKNE